MAYANDIDRTKEESHKYKAHGTLDLHQSDIQGSGIPDGPALLYK